LLQCLTPEELFKDVGQNEESTLSSADSVLILQRLAGATCYDSQVHTTGPLVEPKPKPNPAQGKIINLYVIYIFQGYVT